MNRQPPRGVVPSDRRWSGRLAVVLGAASCAVVALAAAGEPLRRADRRWERLAISPWLLVIPVALVMAIGLVAMSNARPAGRGRLARRRAPWLTMLGFVVVAALFSHLRPEAGAPVTDPADLEVGTPASTPPGRGTGWPTWVVIGVGGAVAVGVLAARRVRRRLGPAPERGTDAEGALRAVESSLDDLREPADPRLAVIAAYRRLLDGLADAGAGRRDSEAPFEHATRALATLGVRPEPLRQLTALFAEARFSDHTITEAHRAAAERALDATRAELEAVRALCA